MILFPCFLTLNNRTQLFSIVPQTNRVSSGEWEDTTKGGNLNTEGEIYVNCNKKRPTQTNK